MVAAANATMEIPEELADYVREVRLPSGRRLHCYEAGGGPGAPLVLVHGLGDEADTWRKVLPALTGRRRVIALDLPGFGRSPGLAGGHTLAAFARVIEELLGALGIGRASLVGSSLGAAVAQRLALARPALVERLVLVGGGLPVSPAAPSAGLAVFLTPGLGERAYTALRRSQDEAYATLRPYYFDLDGLPEADRAFLRRRVWARVWSDGQRRAFLSALRWLAADTGLRAAGWRARLAELATPTLLVWGDHDVVMPPSAGEALARLLPEARLEVIERCGHLPHQERPAEVVNLIEGFLP